MSELIYKICPAQVWAEAETKQQFDGYGIDLVDGYIHFSTAKQVQRTADLHFTGQKDLVLVAVDPSGLAVVWEESRGGQLFPHLYAALPLASVQQVSAIALDENDRHLIVL